jgi:RNA recognition motif-containing protein
LGFQIPCLLRKSASISASRIAHRAHHPPEQSKKKQAIMAVSETIVQSKRALYVGGLGDDVSQVTLRAAFIPFGPLKTIDIVSRQSRIFFSRDSDDACSIVLDKINVAHTRFLSM